VIHPVPNRSACYDADQRYEPSNFTRVYLPATGGCVIKAEALQQASLATLGDLFAFIAISAYDVAASG
jgi:hypothetical protein